MGGKKEHDGWRRVRMAIDGSRDRGGANWIFRRDRARLLSLWQASARRALPGRLENVERRGLADLEPPASSRASHNNNKFPREDSARG